MKRTLLITGTALLAGLANAQVFYKEGHADIGIGHDGTNWDLHFHDDTGAAEYEPHEVVIVAGLNSQWATPASGFGFTGVTGGSSIFRLRQNPLPGSLGTQPFLGIGTEEFLAPAVSYNDPDARLSSYYGSNDGEWISLELVNVSGPGVFSVWSGNSNPTVWMSTNDGIDSTDRFVALPGAHDHVNWGFSQAGTYEVTFRGKFRDASGFQTSGDATYTFEAVPEPASMAALGLGALGLLKRRRNSKNAA